MGAEESVSTRGADDLQTWLRQIQRNIDETWLHKHANVLCVLVPFVCIVEIALFLGMYLFGVAESTWPHFFLWYVLLPGLGNAFFALVSAVVAYPFQKLAFEARLYTVSLCSVGQCCVVATVHGTFYSVCAVFIVPLLLTIIYSRYRLSVVTGACSLVGLFLTGFCTNWDNGKQFTGYFSFELLTVGIILLFTLIVCMYCIRFEKQRREADRQNDSQRYKLRQAVLQDEMTGVWNKTALLQAFARIRLEREIHDYQLAILDLDNFKAINDVWGHLAGDEVLRALGAILQNGISGEYAYRFGGDEFCLLFRDVLPDAVQNRIGQIERELAAYVFCADRDNKGFRVGVSIGLAHWDGKMMPEELLAQADEKLYYQKRCRKGR